MERKKPQYDIPLLVVEGTHYEIGHEVGKTFKSKILKFFHLLNHELAFDIKEFIETADGKKLLEGYISVSEEAYPQYVDEVRGMADGSGMPFHQMFSLSIWSEMHYHLKQNEFCECVVDGFCKLRVDHCSDIMINNANWMVQGHTEDSFENCHGLGYIIQAHITDDNPRGKFWAPVEKFTGFSWPGKLPGIDFGFNFHGIAYSGNFLAPPCVLEKSTPRYFLNRACLAASTIEEIETILKDEGHGISSGISFNFSKTLQDSPRQFYNFEILAVDEKRSTVVKTVMAPNSSPCIHTNLYEHLKVKDLSLKEIPFMDSSRYRKKRFKEMTPPETLNDMIDAISDIQGVDGNTEYTIHNSTTVATVIFDFNNYSMSVYSDRPKTSEPVHVFDLPRK